VSAAGADRRVIMVSLAVLVGLGCGSDEARVESSGTDPDTAGAARARIGVLFDPLRVRVGDTVAGLAVTRVEVTRAALDSSPIGSIAFAGPLPLGGRTIRHFDPDARGTSCFEADSASAATMPRWVGDRRRAWFCFSNAAEARRALGTGEREARIVVDSLVIHRGFSDQVNEARFVRALRLD
jgi:hypothetical protein